MGHVINLGLAKNVTMKTYIQTLQKPNSDLIYNMSINNQKLVDGNGSNRIKKQIIELKYSDKFHFQAAKITKMFNNRLDKFSKYQIGLLETFYR